MWCIWGENLTRLRNLNAAAEYTVDPMLCWTQAEADATRPIPITNGGATINGQRVTGIARNVIVSENEGKSRYYAMSFNYQNKGTDNYTYYRLNYTLSSVKMIQELTLGHRMLIIIKWMGPSANDRTHNINGFIVIIHSKDNSHLGWFVAKRTTH
jgi:hypothetical protein